jgi:hypothetical protein
MSIRLLKAMGRSAISARASAVSNALLCHQVMRVVINVIDVYIFLPWPFAPSKIEEVVLLLKRRIQRLHVAVLRPAHERSFGLEQRNDWLQ